MVDFEKLRKTIERLPERINPFLVMKKPNDPIEIFCGDFQICRKDTVIKLDGKIEFVWLPAPLVKFKGTGKEESVSFDQVYPLIADDNLGKLFINGFLFGEISSASYKGISKGEVSGKILSAAIFDDNSIQVTKVMFTVPNLRDFAGENVKDPETSGMSLHNSRLVFENEKFVVTLDKARDFPERHQKLKEKGGYQLLYFGELIKKSKTISFEEQVSFFESFTFFLSFLNGRRVSPIFRFGCHDGQMVWKDFTPFINDPYKFALSWVPAFETSDINQLWTNFSDKWQDPVGKDCLKTAIHWYIEANNNSGFVEGSIVMVQNALELLYNWIVVEENEMIKEDDARNISAANKIRLLLHFISSKKEIPPGLKSIKKFMTEKKKDFGSADGPSFFVSIRNAIVHSHSEKRKFLHQIPGMVRFEVLSLGLLYVELSLLKILGYNGIFFNRCSGKKWKGDGEEFVPWVKGENS
jgi:hypothetical protein